MIKRIFYKFEHGDKDAPSESSSSSDSDPELEAAEATGEEAEGTEEEAGGTEEEVEIEDNNAVAEVRDNDVPHSSSSGYESEDSSANEINVESSDDGQNVIQTNTSTKKNDEIAVEKEAILSEIPDCILKCKSVFKCKLCPRIILLTEETLKNHLNSKRHARSEKLLKEGRLKLMLNSDGEIDEEVHNEKKLAQNWQKASNSKKNKKRQRQRLNKKIRESTTSEIEENELRNPAKKKSRNEN